MKNFTYNYKKIGNIFYKLLENLNRRLFDLGDESDFINIYDKKELLYNDIKNKLEFSFLDDYTYRRKIQNEFQFENISILGIYHSDFECSKCIGPTETFSSLTDFNNINYKGFFSELNKKKLITYIQILQNIIQLQKDEIIK